MNKRGKYSPRGREYSPSKEDQRIVPLPNAGRDKHRFLYDTAEGFSRPSSPTTHLHQVYVPLPNASTRKRKSIGQRIMESFRETKLEAFEEENINENNRDERVKQSNLVRITSVVSKISRKRTLLITSFRENKPDNCGQKPVLHHLKDADQSNEKSLVVCKYHLSGCEHVFSHTRPQIRLQHEAACKYRTVQCYWTGDTCTDVSIVNIEDHLMLEHGHLVFHVSQKEEDTIRLSEIIPMFHGETSWPDNLARNLGPEVIIISALGQKFLLFLRCPEKMSDRYDIGMVLLGPPQLATKYGYELRLFDDAGYAYRGPMLSVVTPNSQFWEQGFYLQIPNLDVLGCFFETSVRVFHRG